MKHSQTGTLIGVLAITGLLTLALGDKPTLEKQLESEYALTTPTADNTDLVTTGAVLILQKKGLSAGLASSKVPTQNTYKDGQIKAGAAAALRKFGGFGSHIPGIGGAVGAAAGAAGSSRDFVNGEKVYATRIDVDHSKDAIVFYLISDAYDAGRYTASLRIELPKGTVEKNDLALAQPTLDQVFKIAPPDDTSSAQQGGGPQGGPQGAPPGAPAGAQQAPAAAVAAAPPPAPLPDIPPPPPPPPDPAPTQSIAVGQTIDQVVGIMGQPKSVVDLGAKKIYVYPGLKVTFVNGKMTTAE
jgi:hypothetical protein